MDIADRVSQMSYARRLQVGAVIVKEGRIISMGWNGMPSGWDNNCEITLADGTLKSKPQVLHAEMNSLMKLAKSNESGDQASIYVTHSPCIECAKGIHQAGILKVFYNEKYRSDDGIKFLQKCKIHIEQIS